MASIFCGCAAVSSAEEIVGEEARFGRGLDAAPDRRPEALDDGARDASGRRTLQAVFGLLEVEVEVPRLVEDDAIEQIVQHGMVDQAREAAIASQRRELVDRAPGHVDGDEVWPGQREPGREARLDGLAQAPPRARTHLEVVPSGSDEAGERDPVEGFLVQPAGEERRDLGIVDRSGVEEERR